MLLQPVAVRHIGIQTPGALSRPRPVPGLSRPFLTMLTTPVVIKSG